jgi:CubicO group peptidase (beta-lactamase class C family)
MKPDLLRIARVVFASVLATLTAFSAAAQTLTENVDKVFAEFDLPDSPGCALGVVRDGKLVYTRGYGMASLEHAVPNSAKTVYYIGSTSKQFTAASILLAAEQGHLSLDDDIRKYVPEIPDYGVPITIRHLIHHTSGLRDVLTLMAMAGKRIEDVQTVDDYLRMLSRQKELNFQPGDEHLYSNSGYFLMGVIIQRATKKSLRKFADENIFKPLGMTNTHFHDNRREVDKNRAAAYSRTPQGFVLNWYLNFEKVGDGGLMTSVEDLLLWDQNFYANKLGKGDLIEKMLAPGKLNSGAAIPYAHGITVAPYRGVRSVSHGGALMGFRAEMLRLPEQNFSVICLCNVAHAAPSNLARRVADNYLDDVFAKESNDSGDGAKAVALSQAELTPKAGVYREEKTRALRRVTLRDGLLLIDGAPYALENADAFRSPAGTRVRFEKSSDGSMQMIVEPQGLPARTFEAIGMVSADTLKLEEYAGRYRSDELEVTNEIVLRDGKPFLRGADPPDVPLEPTTRDEFTLRGSGPTLAFQRDAQGRVIGMHVYADRVRRMRFERQ